MSVIARVSKFVKNLRIARRALAKFGNMVKAIAKSVAVMSGAIVAAAGIAIGYMVKQAFSLNDILGKTADKLGITTESLAGLQLAVQITGTETAQFSKGLENMARNVADASTGVGEATDALNLLGLDAAKLVRLPVDKMFLALADAVGKVKNQAMRIGAFKDIFGRPGAGLLNMAALGTKRLRELMEFAVKAGIALSRFDVAQIEAANDAVLKTKSAVQGLINQLAVALAPTIKKIADTVTNFLVRLDKKRLRGFFVDMFEFGIVAVAEFLKWLQKIPSMLLKLKAEFLEFGHLVKKTFFTEEGKMVTGAFSALSVVTAQAKAGLAGLKATHTGQRIDEQVAALFGILGQVRTSGGAKSAMGIIAKLFEKPDVAVVGPLESMLGKLGKKLVGRFEPLVDKIRKQVVDPLMNLFRGPAKAAPQLAMSGTLVALLESQLGARGVGPGPLRMLTGRIQKDQLGELQKHTGLLQAIKDKPTGLR